MSTTKSGLAAAALINLNTDDRVYCMFNPHEYTLTKSNSWKPENRKGKNVQESEFQQGQGQVLKLQLLFDTFEDGSDVRSHTDKIWKMMGVDQSKKHAGDGKSEPPKVAFEWGAFYFKAVITNISQKFTLFTDKGLPVRTTVDLTLQQVIDEDDPSPQTAGTTSNTDTKVVTVTSADRADTMAAQQTGDPGNYRDMCERNGINNPKKLPTGGQMSV